VVSCSFRFFRHVEKKCAKRLVGRGYTRQGSLVHAASFFHSAREACPSDPAPRHELGVIAYKTGDVQGAVAYFKAAIFLWEKNDSTKDCVARGGRRAEEEEATMFNLGHCYRRLRVFELAKKCYQRALSLQPRSASTCSALGMTLHALGDCSSAVAIYHRPLRFNPEDALSVACLDRALNDMTLDYQLKMHLLFATTELPYPTAFSAKPVKL